MSTVITTITGAITSFLGAIGTSIVGFFDSLVMDDGALTNLALWLLVFLGLALAIGIARLVFAIFRTRR